ncbi:hypothetical protein ARMGADRAFT_949801 [Armillaria gallica]|uniref:Reverse transcriptase zinc-binding domain-containing protein n=1 Tax=Armillaria gallica TaxID=47427 RepID=A0A2H3CYB7_ARMGA|nr:hypothetical protein ARMGADRAFT_949801 [Armillaria gallica]
MGKLSWFKDVNIAGSRLKFGLQPIPLDVSDPETIDDYRKTVVQSMEKWVLTEIGNSRKLYLLHDRKEPRKGKTPGPVALKMRTYLDVTTAKHRDALVSIVLSTHKLAVERLRWTTPSTERGDRLCRMCMADVETPEHVLFRCTGNDNNDIDLGDDEEKARVMTKMLKLRKSFWSDIACVAPQMAPPSAPQDDTALLKFLLAHRPSIEVTAKYCYRVLKNVYKVPMYQP